MKTKLTPMMAKEVAHKLWVLAGEDDLLRGYGLTHGQAKELAKTVPEGGGEWVFPVWGFEAVATEIADHCLVLDDNAADARDDGLPLQAATITACARRLRQMVQKLGVQKLL